MSRISAIIVTNNSGPDLDRCLAALRGQTLPVAEIIVVDSGSADSGQVRSLCARENIHCMCTDNVGFGRANNLGYRAASAKADFILFINPDAFVSPTAIQNCLECMSEPSGEGIGCLTGRLLGFDREKGKATGYLDSTGIFRKWYGRWYDRGHGEQERGQYDWRQDVPAACGAFMFCRRVALEQVVLSDGAVFDPDFFLYKEDIELSLRLRKYHWRIVYVPSVIVYHCRGWRQRRQMPRRQRMLAVENEVRLYLKHPSMYLLWAIAKYCLVRYINV